MTSFRNILIPVDFTVNTEVAVKKGLELYRPAAASIHLFHVKTKNKSAGLMAEHHADRSYMQINGGLSPEEKLIQWKKVVEKTVTEGTVHGEIVQAPDIQRAIVQKTKQCAADLLIIGKGSNHSWFPFLNTVNPTWVATLIDCPVLTVKEGSLNNKVRSVVLPVAHFFPQRKLELVALLSQLYKLKVYLVTVITKEGNEEQFSPGAIAETFRYLKEVVRCPLEYKVLHNDNCAKAILQFTQTVNADMLLVNPGPETKWSSFTGTQISDVLQSRSRLQILTVKPFASTLIN